MTSKKLEASESKNRDSETKLIKLNSVNKQLKHQLQRASRDLEFKNSEFLDLQSEVDRLRAINAELLENNDDYDVSSRKGESPKKMNEQKVESGNQEMNEIKLIKENKKLRKEFQEMIKKYQILLDEKEKNYSEGTRGIFKIQNHLVATERKNATLISENEILKKSLKESQLELEMKQTSGSSQQDQLRQQLTATKVELNSVQTECSLLVKQISFAEEQIRKIESEKNQMKIEMKKIEDEKEQIEICYERQTIELEEVVQQKTRLEQQVNHRDDFVAKENMKAENFEIVKATHEKLNRSYQKLNCEYEELQNAEKKLTTLNNQLKLQLAKMSADISDVQSHNQQLDITAAKFKNRCEVLMQLKENLEEENRHLLAQINRLMSQNEELHLQTLESKDQIYSEQKQYTEHMQEIRRQKEKLEEKIMDIYKTPQNNSSQKRKSFGATIKKTFQNLGSKSEPKRRINSNFPSKSPEAPDPKIIHDQSKQIQLESKIFRNSDRLQDSRMMTSQTQEVDSTTSGGWSSGRTTPLTPELAASSSDDRMQPRFLRSRAVTQVITQKNRAMMTSPISPVDDRYKTLMTSPPPMSHPVRVDVPPPPVEAAVEMTSSVHRHDIPPTEDKEDFWLEYGCV